VRHDRETAVAMGIRPARGTLLTFAIGFALAAGVGRVVAAPIHHGRNFRGGVAIRPFCFMGLSSAASQPARHGSRRGAARFLEGISRA